MLKIYIQDLHRTPLHLKEQRPADSIDTRDLEFNVVAPISLDLDFKQDAGQVYVTGTIDTEVEYECSRCVEPFVQPIETDVQVRFLSQEKSNTDPYQELQEKDLNISYYSEGYIDVDDHIRENLILSQPVKLLCSEDCQGLCNQCGSNLNQDQCSCPAPEEMGDSRWAALKKLLPSEDKSS